MKGCPMLSYTQMSTPPSQNDFIQVKGLNHIPIYLDNIQNHRQSDDGKQITETTYWDVYYHDPDFKYEFNNGILEEKEMPTSLIDLISQWLELLLYYYLTHNPIARRIRSELGFKIKLEDKTVIRKPDYAILLNTNPNQFKDEDCSFQGTYDICIEFLSKTKEEYVTRDTIDKKNEYEAGNVKEYYIIDANQEHTEFYRLVSNAKRQYYEAIKPQNGLIRSTVLPGFQFRLSDLYTSPNIEKLYTDDVYKSFVKVDYQKQIKKTEQERRAKEQERQAKEDALAKAEQERQAKEQERQAKEDALAKAEQERRAKEDALKEIECLKKRLSETF